MRYNSKRVGEIYSRLSQKGLDIGSIPEVLLEYVPIDKKGESMRLILWMAIAAAVLTWGPDWTRELFFEVRKVVLTTFHRQLTEGGSSLKKLSNDLTGTRSEWLWEPQEKNP